MFYLGQYKRKPGEQYDHHSYRRAIHRACEKAGIECWSPNQLRHTAGTETTALFSLEAGKEFLGHASIKTTEQYYVAPLPELAADVFDAESRYVSMGKKLLDTNHPAWRKLVAVRGKIMSIRSRS